MTRHSIGETVSARLFAAEAAIDHALAEAASLAALLPCARADAWLSAVTGQKAFDGAAASIGALTQARAHMINTHQTLAALARKLGLEPLAVGILDKPDDTPPIGGLAAAPGPFMLNKTERVTANKVLPETA